MASLGTWRRLVAVGVVAAIVVALAVTHDIPTIDELRRLVLTSGWAAPLVFVVFYTGATVLLVPGAALTILAGALFGAVVGTVLVVAGASLGAVASFAIARHLGRRHVERLARGRLRSLDGWIGRNGFSAIFALRLTPLVPFSALNYAAGFSSVRTRAYVIATTLGIVPGSFAYASLGGALEDPWSREFLAALVLVVAVVVLGRLVQRRFLGS